MNSWDKMDSVVIRQPDTPRLDYSGNVVEIIPEHDLVVRIPTEGERFELGEADHTLMTSLAKGGAVHAKYRRMIPVMFTVTAPTFWWIEFDTYKVGTVRNSCSKMHKIHVEPFTLDNFSHEGCDEVPCAKKHLEGTICVLEWLRKKFNATQEKKYWRALIELLPHGYMMKATISLNYEVLVNIHHSRKNHKLDEWHTFCDWIRGLPYSDLITGGGQV
jgi:hypothetical protein